MLVLLTYLFIKKVLECYPSGYILRYFFFQNHIFRGRFLLQYCVKSATKITVWKYSRPKEISGGLPEILLMCYKLAKLT